MLKDFSCTFYDKTITLIRGKSGCGKSTLCNLIAGNLIATSGEIQVKAKLQESQIVYVKQNEKILPGTLRQNITMLDQSIADEEILSACNDLELLETVESITNAP